MRLPIIIIILLSFSYSYPQVSLDWIKHYGSSSDRISSICKSNNNNILALRNSYSNDSLSSFICLDIVDSEGNIISSKPYKYNKFLYGNAICSDNSSNVFITGYTSVNGKKQIYLMKIGSSGEVLFFKVFNSETNRTAISLTITKDNQLLILGNSLSIQNNETDLILLKSDFNGILHWERIFGTGYAELAGNIIVSIDGSYIINASSGIVPEKNMDAWIIKTDTSGVKVFSKNISGVNYDQVSSGIELPDSSFIMITASDLHGSDFLDIGLFKISKTGTKQWIKYYEANNYYDYGIQAALLQDGGFLILGNTKKNSPLNDICLIKTDNIGTKEWIHSLDFGKNDWATSFIKVSETEYLIAGFTDSFSDSGYTGSQALIIKVHLIPSSVNHDPFIPADYLFQNFPNPFNPYTKIDFRLGEETDVLLNIYNIQGKLIKNLLSDFLLPGYYSLIWDGKDDYGCYSASGVYFVKMDTGKNKFCRKIVLLK